MMIENFLLSCKTDPRTAVGILYETFKKVSNMNASELMAAYSTISLFVATNGLEKDLLVRQLKKALISQMKYLSTRNTIVENFALGARFENVVPIEEWYGLDDLLGR